MTSVRVEFVLIFAVVQLCIAEYVVYGRKMTLDNNLSLNPNHYYQPLITQLKQNKCKIRVSVHCSVRNKQLMNIKVLIFAVKYTFFGKNSLKTHNSPRDLY